MGYVTEVKDQVSLVISLLSTAFIHTVNQNHLRSNVFSQGYCGSCWAFSTTGAIEGQLYKKTGQLVSLSEQNLVDCSKSYGTYGCNGAWMANAYDYVVNNGLQSTNSYPYTSVVRLSLLVPPLSVQLTVCFSSLLFTPSCALCHQDTQPCYYDSSRAVAHIRDYRFIPKGDEQALADAVATIGPITVAIDADHSSFLFYSSGLLSSNISSAQPFLRPKQQTQ